MLRADVYEQLKDRMFSGELKTGQFVSQRELTELLGATLNPVREAIRRLEADGLINVYPQKGIQIIEGGPKDINDAYDYRLLIERSALAYLVENGTPAFIKSLRDSVSATLKSIEDDPENLRIRHDALDADFTFHRRIVEHQKNGIISRHYSLNAARLRLFRINTGEPLQRLDIAAREHLAILDAVAERDRDAALALLTEHIEISRQHTLGIRPTRYVQGGDL